jgi:hypothetical protein
MTTLGIYFPNQVTKDEANAIRAGLSEILAEMNITSAYHKSSNRGSPGLGLGMLDSGQLYIGLMPDDPCEFILIEQLRRLAQLYKSNKPPVECDQLFVREIGQELETLADRLEAALNRQ